MGPYPHLIQKCLSKYESWTRSIIATWEYIRNIHFGTFPLELLNQKLKKKMWKSMFQVIFQIFQMSQSLKTTVKVREKANICCLIFPLSIMYDDWESKLWMGIIANVHHLGSMKKWLNLLNLHFLIYIMV